MRNRIPTFVAGMAALAMGCSPETATEPALVENAATTAELHRSSSDLVVMSQNMYVGTDVDAVFAALVTAQTLEDVVPALLTAVATLKETDFPTRAAGFAKVVARTRPHVIGLMEMSKLDLDLTGLGLDVVYHVDFLTELQTALRERNLHYRVVAVTKGLVAAPIPGINYEDYDVMLVDAHRVRVGRNIIARNYTTNFGTVTTGVSLVRGFVSAPIEVDGERYRVTSTHLEADLVGFPSVGGIRAAQMQELLAVIGDAKHAVIMGDLNDFPGEPMYQLAVGAGFADLWAALRPGADGFTCCHSSDLTDARIPDQRIDYIFVRGFERRHDPVDGFIRIFGLLPNEMIAGPTHPIFVSDHAGLVAGLDTPRHFDRHDGRDDRWDDGWDDRRDDRRDDGWDDQRDDGRDGRD